MMCEYFCYLSPGDNGLSLFTAVNTFLFFQLHVHYLWTKTSVIGFYQPGILALVSLITGFLVFVF